MGEATRPLYRGLVSVKGVVLHQGAVVLLKNQRGEWELPGGKLAAGESLTECLVREFAEELDLRVAPGPILGAGLHHVFPDIVVIAYGCYAEPFSAIRHSDEHRAVGWFPPAELDALTIAPGYRRAIESWMRDRRR